jgi:hypothetical protein
VTPRRHPLLQRDSGGRPRLGWGLESTFAGSPDPASVRSLENRGELSDHGSHERLYIGEHFEHGRSIAEHYMESRLIFHWHLRVWPVDKQRDAGDFCARLERSPDESVSGEVSSSGDLAIGAVVLKLGPKPRSCSEGGLNASVLVVVVEVSEKSQWMRPRSLPGVVRLQQLDSCTVVVADALQEIGAVLVEVPTIRADREGCAATTSAATPAVYEGQLVDQVVEGTPEVMGRISNHQSPPTRRLGDLVEDDYPTLILGIEFLGQSYRWYDGVGKNGLGVGLEAVHVIPTTRDLSATTREGVLCDANHAVWTVRPPAAVLFL